MIYRIECGIEPKAALHLKELYAEDPSLEGFVTATIEAIREGDIHVPPNCANHPIKVQYTAIQLIVSSESDRICRIQYIGVDQVRK